MPCQLYCRLIKKRIHLNSAKISLNVLIWGFWWHLKNTGDFSASPKTQHPLPNTQKHTHSYWAFLFGCPCVITSSLIQAQCHAQCRHHEAICQFTAINHACLGLAGDCHISLWLLSHQLYMIQKIHWAGHATHTCTYTYCTHSEAHIHSWGEAAKELEESHIWFKYMQRQFLEAVISLEFMEPFTVTRM